VRPALDVLEGSGRWRSADLLVVVRVDPAVAAARLASRRSQHSRIQQLPAQQRMAELLRGEELLDRLVRWWVRATGRPDRVVAADGTLTAVEHHGDLVDRAVAAVRQG
jgi:hypothetical protein